MFYFQRNAAVAITALVIGFSASTVFAGGSAVIETGSKGDYREMTLEYDNNQRLRLDFAGDGTSYMVMRDDHMYVVMDQAGDKPLVMDIGSTMKMLGSSVQESMNRAQASPGNMETFVSLKDTGDNETIAGIEGDVYELKFKDQDGKLQTESLVLSDDDRALELASALRDMGTQMAKAFGGDVELVNDAFYSAVSKESGGFLRMGENFRIGSFDTETPPRNRFELPAEPTVIPDLGDMFGGAVNQSDSEADGEEKKGFSLGGLFKRQADRQQDRTEDKVDDAIDDATDDAVDSAVDSVLGKIFGR